MTPADDPARAGERFQGRTVLVTGSSRGIGLRLARQFAAEGAQVVVNGRTGAAAEEAAASIREALPGATVLPAAFDVADEAAVVTALQRTTADLGPIDTVVNNAGVQRRSPLTELSLADWRAVLETNLTGAFLVSRTIAPAMIEAGRGVIVHICSVQTRISRPLTAPYAASKAGLAALTRSMCAEWAPLGLRVNALAPGYIDTDLNTALVQDDAFSSWVRSRTPAGRWGRTDDVVGPALWLCSDESAFVNGQVVYADGGMTSVI